MPIIDDLVPDHYGSAAAIPRCPLCGIRFSDEPEKCPNCGTELEFHKYQEHIYKLSYMLSTAGIPHVLRDVYDGYQIIYPSEENRVGDAVCHSYSYGHKQNLLEVMGLGICKKNNGDDVIGWLTAEDAFKYFERQYKKDNP